MEITWITEHVFLLDRNIVAVAVYQQGEYFLYANAHEVPEAERTSVVYTVDGLRWLSRAAVDTLATYFTPDTAPRR